MGSGNYNQRTLGRMQGSFYGIVSVRKFIRFFPQKFGLIFQDNDCLKQTQSIFDKKVFHGNQGQMTKNQPQNDYFRLFFGFLVYSSNCLL